MAGRVQPSQPDQPAASTGPSGTVTSTSSAPSAATRSSGVEMKVDAVGSAPDGDQRQT